ncbi:MAG: GNAT family N-acetyltransferase [Actinomycetes bacterium]
MDPPVLVDGPVLLRAPTTDDMDAIVQLRRDETVVAWTLTPPSYGRGDADRWLERSSEHWEQGTACSFVLEVEGLVAGQVGLDLDGDGAADIGYVLAERVRGRGVMSHALRLALSWAFHVLALDVVHWRCFVGNWPSRRVAWACGFALEGQVRDLVAQRGVRRAAWVGSLCRGEPLAPRSRWLDVPELRSRALTLRANRPDDAARIVEACSDPWTQQWLPDLPSPYTADDAQWYLESRPEQMASGRGVYWAVADPGDDVLLAQVGLMGLDESARSGEIGYWTHPDARGRGVMARAVSLVARHAMLPEEDGGLGLARTYLRVAAGNRASLRVAEKARFTDCGVDRRAARLRDGSVQDYRRLDLLADEMEQAWAHPSALR